MYVIVWPFEERPGYEEEFRRAYCADGDWVKLFRTDLGFVSVGLLRDPRDPYHVHDDRPLENGECVRGILPTQCNEVPRNQ